MFCLKPGPRGQVICIVLDTRDGKTFCTRYNDKYHTYVSKTSCVV